MKLFPGLPVENAPATTRPLRICIASCEFVGPIRNGGIGTAYSALAHAIAAAGHEVTLLYTQGQRCENRTIAHWESFYREHGVRFVARPSDAKLKLDAPEHVVRSYETYLWLKQQNFDLVHFPEWGGDGYYSLSAKHQGLAFQQTQFCIGTHSPNAWIKQANSEYYSHPRDLELDFMERRSVELADIVVSPCHYMLNWLEEHGVKLPERAYVQPNILPTNARAAQRLGSAENHPVSELVFFGRLETRKGIELFCDALDRQAKEGQHSKNKNLRITFLGKPATVNGRESRSYIQQRAASWPWPWKIISDLDQPGAMKYLKEPGRLAIIPSLLENSPYTVLECLGGGIPFLASRVGGIPELIATEQVEAATFTPAPAALAQLLAETIKNGARSCRPAVDPIANEAAWVTWHGSFKSGATSVQSFQFNRPHPPHPSPLPRGEGASLSAQKHITVQRIPKPVERCSLSPRERAGVRGNNAINCNVTAPNRAPLVSVCVSHFNRPKLLQQALDSLADQTYSNFEVIVVDDGSTNPEAIEYLKNLEPWLAQRNWRLVRQENRYLSAARNTGARHAKGEYLLFMDDDNFAKLEELSTFVSVALHTGAEIVTSCMDYFEGTGAPASNGKPVTRWVPLGAVPDAGYFRNCFGDANCLVKRSTFERLGGFTEIYGVTHEDWEFLADAVLKECHLEVIPEALFYYRYSPNSMIRATSKYRNHLRHIRPYLDSVPPALRPILLVAQGAWMEEAAGSLASSQVYARLSVQWRSQCEAGRKLAQMGQKKPALEMMLAALKAIENCNHPVVILEALLEIGRELRDLDVNRARETLRLALQLAETVKRPEAVQMAKALLNEERGLQSAASQTENQACEQTRTPAKSVKDCGPKTSLAPSDSPSLVSIIIPTFNRLDLTERCLRAIETVTKDLPYEIVIVDNASTDGTRKFLSERSEALGKRLVTIFNEPNLGFSRACNQGAQAANGSFLLFLNNDTEVTSGWLAAMIGAARNPEVGVVGAKLLYPDRTIQHAGIGFINGIPDHPHRHCPSDAPEVNKLRELDMVTGACLLMPCDLFLQLGGFDEVYQNGVEDIDLCLRARTAGRKVIYTPKAEVFHLEGQSEGRFNHVQKNLELFFNRWGKCFDAQKRFVPPPASKIIKSSRSLFCEPESPLPNDKLQITNHKSQISVAWEGTFLDYGSLSHVNRELTRCLAKEPDIALARVCDQKLPNGQRDPNLLAQAPKNTQITIRHAWPPNWAAPKRGSLVIIQPWEYGALPEQWVRDSAHVTEFWVPSNYVREVYINSGVPAKKVHVVPNGIDPAVFHPGVAVTKLATRKSFKFLFVGGTIHRKGPDLLLKAYLENFTASDDVCLVIKDFGGQSVYAGQTFEAQIRQAQSQPGAPEILYLNEEMSADAMPGLYRACDCFVLPYRGEGFGLPLLEAMACGLPVITTAGGASDDFVCDQFAWRIPAQRHVFGHEISGMKLAGSGWLLEPDPNALAHKMRWAFEHPEEARERGRLASKHAHENFTWEKAARISADRLRQIAGARPSSAAATSKKVTQPAITLPECAKIAHLGTARDLLRQKKFGPAWETTLEALAKRPFNPEAFLLLAEIASGIGAGQDARTCAEHARKIAPAWKPAKQFLNQRLKGSSRPEWLKLPSFNNPPRLSVCLITRNEEKFLAQCLHSIKEIAQQIVVLDTGSTDRTVEIAKEHGAEVHHFTWCDDFSAARNAAIEHTTGDWVLILDADEELATDAREKLLTLLNDSSVIAWRLPIVDVGREAEGCSYVPRLFRNAPGLFYVGRVHEQVFSSIEVRRQEWGLENRLGDAKLIHHGYTAEVTRERNKVERNLRLLERAIEELPDEPHLLMNLGLELSRSGRETEGIQKYREAFDVLCAKPAAEIVPELLESLLTQFCSRLANAKEFSEIVRVLTRPAASRPGLTASLHFSLGLAHMELGQLAEAAAQFQRCLAKRNQPTLSPINKDISTAAPHHCLALCLSQLRKNTDAEKAFQDGLSATGHTSNLRLDYARFLFGQGRAVDALHRLHEIVAENAQHSAAWRFGGQISLSQPEFLEFACDWTKEAITYLPNDSILLAQRAEVLLLNQQLAESRELWRRVVAAEQQPRAQAALILCELDQPQFSQTIRHDTEQKKVSRAFLEWYRKLITFRAHKTLLSLHEKGGALRALLPEAAEVIEKVIAEAGPSEARPQEVGVLN